jgi:EAL domain-containing protein (putative c-di-GMP-specific phosphodiesterase class I)
VLQQADMAMYQAKRGGRNSFCVFNPAMKEAISAYSNLEQELGQAIRNDELELFFQPQCDFDGRIMSAEALLRWRHPSRGLITPKDFIGIAEESGLILPIGLWVIGEACRQIKDWQSEPAMKDIQIAINVSAGQFKQTNFVDEVIQAISASHISASCIKLELTESMMHNIDETRVKMEKIRELGVRFSLDDFGTGYSSLSSLTQLPLEQLKIDQSFVFNMLSRTEDQIVVKTIIAMAHSLGLQVIAEGLETEAQRNFLHEQGCLLYQGYLFSPALPADEFLERVVAQSR